MGPCDHKEMHGCKNDPCTDVSQKYLEIYLIDENPRWVQKGIQTNDLKPAAFLSLSSSIMAHILYIHTMHQVTHSLLDIQESTKDKEHYLRHYLRQH